MLHITTLLRPSRVVPVLRKLGVASVVFFTLKGLVWLAVLATAASGWFGRA